jgi:PAS domain S-box-containing protein
MEKRNISKNLLFSQKHFDLILKLNKTSFVEKNSVTDIFNVITESLVEGLNIDRASYWKFEDEKLKCVNLYDNNAKSHLSHIDIDQRDLPIYFQALSDGIAIVADDVMTNQYTQELKENYLIPLGITDMLDLPIRENGKVIGVLCCEHRDDPRIWNESDLAFAKSVADILALMLEHFYSTEIEKRLIDSERKVNLISEYSSDGFVVLENSQVTYASPSYCNLLGFTVDEALKLNSQDILNNMHPDDREIIRVFVAKKLALKESSFKYEFRSKTKSGAYFWREDTASVLYDKTGKYTKFIVISRDINQSKIASEEVKRLYEVSQVQNRKLVDFTYIVSHNIRSNSCNISMLLDLIEETKDASEKEEYYKLLKESNNKLTETLHYLNETISVRNNPDNLKIPVNVRKEVEKVLQSINAIIKKENVDVEINIDDKLEINTIPSYFESIMFNLISNSVKYKSNIERPKIEIFVKMRGTICEISVKDNGLGIDLDKNKEKIFGMYKTFHNNEDAVGIGLFMTKNHVETLGGKIDVISKVNEGSQFKISLYE